MDKPNLQHILSHYGENRDEHFGALVGPIYQSSNFKFDSVKALQTCLDSDASSVIYSRGNNPTLVSLRKKLAALEVCDDSLVFSSGVAAIAAAIFSVVKAGDHIVCVQEPYGWTKWLCADYLKRFNISCSFVDGKDLKNFEKARQKNTRLVMLESPNSFLFDLQDLEAVANWTKQHDIVSICDNSYSSPLFQNPHSLGIDMVVHSASKYLSGHSDIVAGVLCSTKERIEKIYFNEYMGLGAILGPFEAFLMQRGLRTLELRMQRAAETATFLVERLTAQGFVKQVYYPYHKSHPQWPLAKKQMQSGAGQFSIELKEHSEEKVIAFTEALKHFQIAVSWGGFESLVIPALVKGEENPYPKGLVRFYCGLEKAEDLLEDILRAAELLERD